MREHLKQYSASQKKVYTFQKSPHINIFRKFSYVWVAIGLFYQMIPKYLTILYAWVSRSHICEICQNPGLTGIGIDLSAISNIESREKASKLLFWWSDDNLWKNMLCCVYILTYAIDTLCCIELLITLLSIFGYFLVFHSINYHSINYITHQKVTKTLNKVINSSMKHKISMAYVRIYTQQSIFFHKLSSNHQNDNFEFFSRLSSLLIAAKTNTNSCQAWILVNFTNVAPAHSSIPYRQFFWYHLIEETHSYPHVWKFPENILKYLYRGTLEKCKLFIETHCRVPKALWTQAVMDSALRASGRARRAYNFLRPLYLKILDPLLLVKKIFKKCTDDHME